MGFSGDIHMMRLTWHIENTWLMTIKWVHCIEFRKLECISSELHNWCYLWLGFMHSKVANWHLSIFEIVRANNLWMCDPIFIFSHTLDKNLHRRWISITYHFLQNCLFSILSFSRLIMNNLKNKINSIAWITIIISKICLGSDR